MHGYTVFSRGEGCGYIHDNPDDIRKELMLEPVTINGTVINHGTLSTLDDYFCRPLLYLGLLPDNEMIFKIGETSSLFEQKHYYQSVFKIDENRIFEMFSWISGRDHIFIGGAWK